MTGNWSKFIGLSPTARLALLFAVILLALGLTSCDETGTKPHPVQELLYVGARHIPEIPEEYRIYKVDAASLTLLDSIVVDGFPIDLVASPDGKYLYVGMASTGRLYKMNLSTLDFEWDIDQAGWMQLLDHGSLLVHGNEVHDALSGELLFHAPDTLVFGLGAPSGTAMAAVIGDRGYFGLGDTVVVKYDLQSRTASGRYVPSIDGQAMPLLLEVRLHPNGRFVGVYARDAIHRWIVLGDLETGETILTHQLSINPATISFSADGKYLAIAVHGSPFGTGIRPTLDLYDLETLEHLRRFSNTGSEWHPDSVLQTGQSLFMQTGHYLISVPEAGLSGRLHQIDLNTLELTKSLGLPGINHSYETPNIGGATLLLGQQ